MTEPADGPDLERHIARRRFLQGLAAAGTGAVLFRDDLFGTSDQAGAVPGRGGPKASTTTTTAATTTTTTPPTTEPATTTTTSAPAQGTAVVLDAATDGTDQTARIQAQIDAAPNGTAGAPTVIRFPVGEATGSYRVEGTISLIDKSFVVLEGPSPSNKARIRRTQPNLANPELPHSNWHIEVYRSSNVTVRNLFIEGYHLERYTDGSRAGFATTPPALAAEREIAFQVMASNNVTVQDCRALNVRSYVCQATIPPLNDPPYVASTNVVFRNLLGVTCGGWGACLVGCHGVLVDNLRIERCGFGGVDMEPLADHTVGNVEIRNCWIQAHGTAFPANGYNAVNDVWIHDCHVERSNNWPLVFVHDLGGGRRSNWRIERVTHNIEPMDNGHHAAFSFTKVDGVVVRQCRVNVAPEPYMAGVHLDNCGGQLEVVENVFGSACTSGAGAVTTANGTGPVVQSGNTTDGSTPC